MNPSRAAWCFAAGLAWLVLRGILVHAIPAFGAAEIAQKGGLWLGVPLLSFAASLTAPIFFGAFLRHHPFASRGTLRLTTIFALTASVLSCVLVGLALVATVRGSDLGAGRMAGVPSWFSTLIPLAFVVSIFLFLVAFSRADGVTPKLRSAARVAAVGTSVPIVLIAAWIANSAFGVPAWYPAFSRGLAARVLGLAAAATLLWFLESFATRYGRGADAS
jgi:hypothetical protein